MILAFQTSWLQQDGPKLFFFACCFVALLALAHYASRKSETSYAAHSKTAQPLPPEPEPPQVESDQEPPEDVQAETPSAEDSAWLPPARTVSFVLREIRFKSFDIETGPPDPESFCDEVSVEITYRRGIMPWDFTVATPRGLEARFKNKDWDTVFVGESLIVPRYDAGRITEALLLNIKTRLESVPEEVAEDEMKEADPAT
jgi:hypothetical protein